MKVGIAVAVAWSTLMTWAACNGPIPSLASLEPDAPMHADVPLDAGARDSTAGDGALTTHAARAAVGPTSTPHARPHRWNARNERLSRRAQLSTVEDLAIR